MGMFDTVKCHEKYLHDDDLDREFQTKDLDSSLDLYEIREDGSLWHEEYDIEDHSDPKKEGLGRFVGAMTQVNKRWVRVEDLTDTVRFYDYDDETHSMITYVAQYTKGKLAFIEREVRSSNK